jgi:peptidase inhibitor family I36
MKTNLTLTAGTMALSLGMMLSGAAASASSVGGLGSCTAGCLWNGTNYGGSQEEVMFQSFSSLPSGISNNEKSAANKFSGKYVRFYFGPSFSGAWRCFNPNAASSDLHNLTFNKGNGRGGFGQSLFDNIASVGINTSACTG